MEDVHFLKFDNLIFIPVELQKQPAWIAFWRRFIYGFFKPSRYSIFWYWNMKPEDHQKISSLVNQADAIMIFRLYMFPVLVDFLTFSTSDAQISVDMDDAETDTYQQLTRLQWKNRNLKDWCISKIGLFYMRYYERNIPGQVNTIYFSNKKDIYKHRTNYSGKQVLHFSNKIPVIPRERRITKNRDTVLFVGTLNYYPNLDAIEFLINKIWPLIVKSLPAAKLIIAGSKPGDRLKRLIQPNTSISLIENPPSIQDVFEKANILIVPLRAGGGTRIKILQAFSYGVPVVSTAIGVDGLDIVSGVTCLVAEEAKDIASACSQLLTNAALYNEVSNEAYDFYLRNYSFKM